MLEEADPKVRVKKYNAFKKLIDNIASEVGHYQYFEFAPDNVEKYFKLVYNFNKGAR